MSQATFMAGQQVQSLELLYEQDAAPVYPGELIRVYNIHEKNWVGVEYPDRARQVHPVEWWLDKLAGARRRVIAAPADAPLPQVVRKRVVL